MKVNEKNNWIVILVWSLLLCFNLIIALLFLPNVIIFTCIVIGFLIGGICIMLSHLSLDRLRDNHINFLNKALNESFKSRELLYDYCRKLIKMKGGKKRKK